MSLEFGAVEDRSRRVLSDVAVLGFLILEHPGMELTLSLSLIGLAQNQANGIRKRHILMSTLRFQVAWE